MKFLFFITFYLGLLTFSNADVLELYFNTNVFLTQQAIDFDTIQNKSIQDVNIYPETLPNKNNKEVYSISGKIFMGDNLLPEGKIYLLENSKGVINSIQSERIDEGSFQFSHLNPGDFFCYIIPEFDYNFLYYPKYLPTYSGQTYTWKNADFRTLTDNFNECNVNLINYDTPFYGNKSIGGNLTYSKSFSGIKNIPVTVLLLDDKKTPMDFTIANEINGKYYFNNLPDGIYYIHPEIPGIITEDCRIVVNDIGNNNEINFLIENKLVKIQNENNIDCEILGNTIKIKIDINVTSPILCDLLTSTGFSVFRQLFYSNEVNINTDNFTTGIYFIRVQTLDNLYFNTHKIYINNHL